MTNLTKKNTILLTIISFATLIIAICGATFAYFTAKVRNDTTNKEIVIKSAQIGTVNFITTNEIRLENAYPGATSNKLEFSISSDDDASSDVKYNLNWSDILNDFVNKNDLVYTLTAVSDKSENPGIMISDKSDFTAPESDTLIGNGTLKPGETHSYSLIATFKETGGDQNVDQGKTFIGKIQASLVDSSDDSKNNSKSDN